MIPLTGQDVEAFSVAPQDMARRTPSGGLRSPARGSSPALSEPPAPSSTIAPELPTSRWQKLRHSVWAPVLLKVGGACIGLLGLSIAGAASLREAPAGVRIQAEGTEWLSGDSEMGDQPKSLPAPAAPQPLLLAHHPAPGAPADGEKSPCVASPMPSSEPEPAVPPESSVEPLAAPEPGITPDGRIILNVASIEELTRLSGIGKRRAEQIVLLRERLGKFKRVTDLLRVKGIGPKGLKKITPQVVLDAPRGEPSS